MRGSEEVARRVFDQHAGIADVVADRKRRALGRIWHPVSAGAVGSTLTGPQVKRRSLGWRLVLGQFGVAVRRRVGMHIGKPVIATTAALSGSSAKRSSIAGAPLAVLVLPWRPS